jgi:hypothetical protein
MRVVIAGTIPRIWAWVKFGVTFQTADPIVMPMPIGKMGFVIEGAGERARPWLLVPLNAGWIAAYRLTYRGAGARRRARIAELRIVPGHGAFDSSRDYALSDPAVAEPGYTPTPFSFDMLRRGLTARGFDDALAAAAAPGMSDPFWVEFGVPPPFRESPPKPRGPGRPPKSPAFYAAFAIAYNDIENIRRREARTSTRDILARRYKVPVTTIGKWILRARQLGFLGVKKRVRGQRGGFATPAAYAVAEKGQSS